MVEEGEETQSLPKIASPRLKFIRSSSDIFAAGCEKACLPFRLAAVVSPPGNKGFALSQEEATSSRTKVNSLLRIAKLANKVLLVIN